MARIGLSDPTPSSTPSSCEWSRELPVGPAARRSSRRRGHRPGDDDPALLERWPAADVGALNWGVPRGRRTAGRRDRCGRGRGRSRGRRGRRGPEVAAALSLPASRLTSLSGARASGGSRTVVEPPAGPEYRDSRLPLGGGDSLPGSCSAPGSGRAPASTWGRWAASSCGSRRWDAWSCWRAGLHADAGALADEGGAGR